jgi:hypothetical protein
MSKVMLSKVMLRFHTKRGDLRRLVVISVCFLTFLFALGQRLVVLNPSNTAEELSERWNANDGSYQAFVTGILDFERAWSSLSAKRGEISWDLVELFGEPVKPAFTRQAHRLQEVRSAGQLGVTRAGAITGASGAAHIIRPNTFYGEE